MAGIRAGWSARNSMRTAGCSDAIGPPILPGDGVYDRLAQQPDLGDLLGFRNMEGHVLRADLRVAVQPFDDRLRGADEIEILPELRLFRRQLLIIGGDQDAPVVGAGDGLV